MRRTKMLRFNMGDRRLSAPISPLGAVDHPEDSFCPRCLKPIKEHALAVLDVVQYGLTGNDYHMTMFDCQACGKRFAFAYTIGEKENG